MGDASAGGWTLIESDPGVFSELLAKMGVEGCQVEELYGLDAESLGHAAPYGLVFLFKWRGSEQEAPSSSPPPSSSSGGAADSSAAVFFAQQTIQNACATQALLHVALNAEGVKVGDTLASFREFVEDFSPDMKGEAIGNSEVIRASHNAFARPEPVFSEGGAKPAGADDDVYHFISYVPVQGRVYELDGLKPGPILLGEVREGEDWTAVVAPALQARVESYGGEIRFNLMALCRNRVEALEEQLAALGGPGAPGTEGIEDDLDAERLKHARWRDENLRRKHNYIPFLFNYLQRLAARGKLEALIARARVGQAGPGHG